VIGRIIFRVGGISKVYFRWKIIYEPYIAMALAIGAVGNPVGYEITGEDGIRRIGINFCKSHNRRLVQDIDIYCGGCAQGAAFYFRIIGDYAAGDSTSIDPNVQVDGAGITNR
jgi:hypothetical protein